MASNHYINNAEFLKSIKRYKRNKSKGIPNYIGECFMQIANRLARKPNFVNYSYKEDMIGDAIENCVQCLGNFDPQKSKNPFAYFTQIIWYAFLRRIAKEKKQSYIKLKCIENEGLFDPDAADEVAPSHSKDFLDQARYSIFDYEEKMNLKKKKTKKTVKKKGLEKLEDD